MKNCQEHIGFKRPRSQRNGGGKDLQDYGNKKGETSEPATSERGEKTIKYYKNTMNGLW